jgi:hypothetical protein
MKFEDCQSKAAQLRFIREKLASDPRWLVRGLLTIYTYQTADEQRAEATEEHNGVGFNGADGKYLTSMAKQVIQRNVEAALRSKEPFSPHPYITEKQWPIVYKKMQKYAEQLRRVAVERMAQKQQS